MRLSEMCAMCATNFKLKFDLENKMGISIRCVNELKNAGTHGTHGTHLVKSLIYNDILCARNENIPGTHFSKLAHTLTGGEPQHREP
jgi:hypothetical protein